MKKLITSIAICLVTAILLSACSTSGAFTKRRYTRGYYVSHQHDRHTTPIHPAAEKSKQQVAPVAPVNKAEGTVAEQPEGSLAKIAPESGKTAKAISQIKRWHAANRYVKNRGSADPLELTVRESFNLSNPVLSAEKTSASDEDALSLLWIVIIVILILWLLGVITGGWGLGGLIHLLLIIALILLILWLLRIL